MVWRGAGSLETRKLCPTAVGRRLIQTSSTPHRTLIAAFHGLIGGLIGKLSSTLQVGGSNFAKASSGGSSGIHCYPLIDPSSLQFAGLIGGLIDKLPPRYILRALILLWPHRGAHRLRAWRAHRGLIALHSAGINKLMATCKNFQNIAGSSSNT